ncbi:hypothetical protein [Shivajiella indica]|uniref:Uncharacterized protein n=1 Tax=Shivajiella indica TaxID=872115 RepID=A0ABW5BBM2_9BACT
MRLLLAVPMFILSEKYVDKRILIIISQFLKNGMVNENNHNQFEQILQKFQRIAKKKRSEIVIILLVVVYGSFRLVFNNFNITSWIFPFESNEHKLSWAGYWLVFISLPVFQFLIIRWMWRWILWLRLLLAISKSGILIFPPHPDKAGGLGFLGERPLVFGSFSLVLGVVYASILVNRILYLDFTLDQQIPFLIAFAAFSLIINIVPLIFFSELMRQTRLKYLHYYNSLGVDFIKDFEEKWLYQKKEKTESTAQQGLTLNLHYNNIYEMKTFPFDLKSMLASVILTILPLVPLLLFYIPFKELLEFTFGMLF